MARVLIFGGHGKVALLAAPALVQAGHEVTSVFRNQDHTDDVAATGATPSVADLENLGTDELRGIVDGYDAVVFTAGAGGGSPERTYAVDRDAAKRAIDAAAAAGVQRFVMVSYAGAGPDHGIPEDDSFYPYAQSKAEADAHLREADLAWTILKPATLTTEKSTGTLRVLADEGSDSSEKLETSRALVADVIAAVVSAPVERVGRTELAFVDGDTPIEEALAGLGSTS